MTELWDLLVGPFIEFGFMRRALAGCLALSLGAAPVGVFLLVGPSGVGKTETALTLVELLYGGARNLITNECK